jgi:hypothetical protein
MRGINSLKVKAASERESVQRLQHHRRKCMTWVEEFSAHIERPNADKVSIKFVGNFEGFFRF